jgi:hypothetical protein
MVGDVYQGKGSFLGCCYWLEILSSLVPPHVIPHSKIGSYQAVLSPGKVMISFRHVPQA